jgi:hypothetical protein
LEEEINESEAVMPSDKLTREPQQQGELAREGEGIQHQGRAISEDRWAESEAAEQQQEKLAEELTDSAGRKVPTTSNEGAARGDPEVERVNLAADPEPSRH